MTKSGGGFSRCVGWLVGRGDSNDEDSDRARCFIDPFGLRHPGHDSRHHNLSVNRHHHYMGMLEER
jgi:hypothetical protein